MQMRFEEPALVIPVPEDQIDLSEEGEPPAPEFLDDLRDQLQEFGLTDEDLPYEEVGIGRGASSLALLLFLAAVFLSGKKINENLDAWIAIAKKVRALVERLRNKQQTAIYVSDSVALALAAAEISTRYALADPGQVVFHQRFPVRGGFSSREVEESFRYNPERFYLFAFDVNGEKVYVVGMKSTGEIIFLHELDTIDFYAFHGFRSSDPEDSP